MKEFEQLNFELAQAYQELQELYELLQANEELSERGDILPFFRERKHLCGLIGFYVLGITGPDRIAYELQLFGDYSCDLVIGDSTTNTFCFIEFEEGKSDSIFKVKKPRTTPYWSNCFERAYSQVTDWLWILDDMKQTAHFQNLFGSSYIDFEAFILLGRSKSLTSSEFQRLDWREKHTVINSHKIHIRTFDDLYLELNNKIQLYQYELLKKK